MFSKSKRGERARLLLLGLMVAATAALPHAALAQSSSPRSINVPFAAPISDGYAQGSVQLQYAYLACFGELHLALRLAPNSARSNGVYRLGGKTYVAEGAPQVSVVTIRGRAARAGSEVIADFTKGAIGPDTGLGCFSGDLQKLGVLTTWLGPKPTQAQIVNFLNSLTLSVEPLQAVRDSGLESRLRAEDQRRQAAVEAQQKAAREAAEARRVAEAKRAADAARPISRTPTGAGGGNAQTAPTPRVQAPPQLTREQRIANAIASDKVLADKRLEEQRRIYAQQQQAMASAQQRQNEAMIAAAPAMMELGAGIYGALEGFDTRWKQRQYQAAQAKMAGKCKLPNGLSAPKDGNIEFGVEISKPLGKTDCGDNHTDRFKAFQLELDQPARVRFTIRPSTPWVFTSFQIFVNDIEKKRYGALTWRDWGGLQKVNSMTLDLPAGIYVVEVSNGVEDIFAGFVLRADRVDAQGRVLAAAPPRPAAPAQPVGAAKLAPFIAGSTATPVPAPAARMASPGGAHLGLTVAPGSRGMGVVLAVSPDSPAEAAGVQVGDEVNSLQGAGFFGEVAFIRDQAQLDAWLAKHRPGQKYALVFYRGDQLLSKPVTLAAAP